MKAALFHLPLLPVAAAFLLSSCGQQQQIEILQTEISRNKRAMTELQDDMNRLQTQVKALTGERDKLKEGKAQLEAGIDKARQELEAVKKSFENYRSQYRVSMKTRAPGMALGELVVAGRSYTEVKVKEATDDTLCFLHSTGTEKMEWKALPPRIQQLFGQDVRAIEESLLPQEPPPGAPIQQRIAWFDAHMHHFQQEIGELERDLEGANDDYRKNQSTISKLNYNKQDTTAQERARGAFEVKIQRIKADIKTIEDKQRKMMSNDPRKIKQGNLSASPPKP